MNKTINDTRLSPHFKLGEFINLGKYPENRPTLQDVINMTYGCQMLLEPARQVVGPIIINSGFRNVRVNTLVGLSARIKKNSEFSRKKWRKCLVVSQIFRIFVS